MNTIYHYCDLNGFLNIIKYKKLWVSATNNLNDYKEVDWFVGKVYSKLNELVTEENKELLNEFWQLKTINAPMPYICSFSKNGDLLSQWRAYADDGHGIAIGFNRDYFKFEVDIPSPNILSKMSIGMSDVIYDEAHQDQLINEIIRLIQSPFEDDQDKNIKLMHAATLVNRFSYVCKNWAFREEDEVRVIHTPLITGNKEGNTQVTGGISDLNYRVSAQALTSYFELDFSEEKDSSAILDIVLGPKCKVSRFDIELFLSINGFGDVPFRVSSASYR